MDHAKGMQVKQQCAGSPARVIIQLWQTTRMMTKKPITRL